MHLELEILQEKLLKLASEANLELKLEVEEYELEPAQDDIHDELKSAYPDAAIVMGFHNEYLQRFFVLNYIENKTFEFIEMSRSNIFTSFATEADDGEWDLDERETRKGEYW
ncbi:hypothetical protein [Aliivibrio fischeri]|uniref:hypothetical protein n=1 Tax=Aliivibrio fischeri TaxID=668 RepID=UPI0012DAD86C|nr:hypothetical protein [Aliivibrio fischeri]MUK70186.1 hypothetical protein [Aliivibrio fischeri]MUK72720.1 hypothetical protein [Aliivibrio fischeri]